MVEGKKRLMIHNKKGDEISRKTIHSQIRTAMIKNGMYEKYKGNLNHSLRKYYAQKYYDYCRKEGASRKKATGLTNETLGHNFNRGKNGIKTYVKNMW